MSYSFPTKDYPIAADVDAVATFLAQRQSDSGTTNGGIVAGGGSTAVPQLGVDASGLGISYMKGIADATMCAVGYQASDVALAIGTATRGANTFADVGNGTSTGYTTWSFSAPIAKTYLVHVDLQCYMTVAADSATFQLVNTTTSINYGDASAQITMTALNSRTACHFLLPVVMQSGANVLKLQWKTTGVGTAQVDVADFRKFTVTG